MIIKMVKYVIFQMFMRHSDIYGDFSAEKAYKLSVLVMF